MASGGQCAICEGALSRAEMHVDHIIPVCDGGKTEASNLRATHRGCNMAIREGRAKGGRPTAGTPDDPLRYRLFGVLTSQKDWLLTQPGGASAALRRMIAKAMKRSRHAKTR